MVREPLILKPEMSHFGMLLLLFFYFIFLYFLTALDFHQHFVLGHHMMSSLQWPD